jgi:DHA1 family multidrug resistance protein-like MFS transporter
MRSLYQSTLLIKKYCRWRGGKSRRHRRISVLTFFFPGGEMSRVSQARSLGKYFLLVDNMLVVLGFFVVFPLISIRFVDQMGWAALMVGIALGLRQFVQQGLGVLAGPSLTVLAPNQ